VIETPLKDTYLYPFASAPLNVYTFFALSFREYLSMFHQIHVPVYTLEEILEHKVEIPGIAHPLPLFAEYIQHGYYPFSTDITFDIELN